MTLSTNNKTALVIGATGGVGGAIATALVARGWTLKALNRDPAAAAKRAPGMAVQWIAGDSMNAADVLRAAEGVSVVVHGANPPGYKNWKGLVLPMLESSIGAAKAKGARLVLPGTVYNYGPDAGNDVSEEAAQNPVTRKGAIRVAMEQRLQASGVKTLIVRAGDFFAPSAGNNWFAQGLVTPGKPLSAITYPGEHTVGHQWAYLPDLGEAFARLLDRESELEDFARFHFGGHWLNPGVEMAETIRRVAGKPQLRIKSLPWFALRLIAPFNETMREMLEMRYLWKRPLRLTNAKLTAFLGSEPHTPLDDAVRATLKGLKISF
jgi:nucleoside-diphosphate-sugar epimerase